MGVQALAHKVTRLEAVARSPIAASLAILVCVRADPAVLVDGHDAVDAGPDHPQEGVIEADGIAGVRGGEDGSQRPAAAVVVVQHRQRAGQGPGFQLFEERASAPTPVRPWRRSWASSRPKTGSASWDASGVPGSRQGAARPRPVGQEPRLPRLAGAIPRRRAASATRECATSVPLFRGVGTRARRRK